MQKPTKRHKLTQINTKYSHNTTQIAYICDRYLTLSQTFKTKNYGKN